MRARAAQPFLPLLLLAVSLPLSAAPDPAPAKTPAASPARGERRVVVSDDFTALLEDGALFVEARAVEGETPIEFSRRIARDEATAARVLALPEIQRRTGRARLPYPALSDEARLAAVRALFPSDVRATAGWLHIAVADERFSAIAEWFAGDPARGPDVARHNRLAGDVAPRGTALVVPAELLLPPFRDAEPVEEAAGPPSLSFDEDAKGRFALYRLRRGEALYSAVVVRFTGRLHAEDVIQLALTIAERSGIEDVHAIPVGFGVKIPIELLTEEFLPADDPRAVALAREKAETSQFSARARASGLEGVRVVLDAGHGGRDTGTIHHGVWESTYVYDVACRVRKLLLETTRADVVMTTEEPSLGFAAPNRDRLANGRGRRLLTSPPYFLDDPVVGVNLRWYLANAILKRPAGDQKRIPPEKTVFLSIHADSLHPAVRGAMAYVPGERFLRERYGKRGADYASFAEYRQEPMVSFSKRERAAAEGVSTVLAQRLLAAIRQASLPVHQFSPVRTHVIRGGGEWVPAVLRYNRIPNRVLLEVANLSNDDDRALTLTRDFRQRMAAAVVAGLLDFFEPGGRREPRAAPPAAARTPERPPTSAALPEIQGPWPERHGPWPEIQGPWPTAARTPTATSPTARPSPKRTARPTKPTPRPRAKRRAS